jgi:hypothetical protein
VTLNEGLMIKSQATFKNYVPYHTLEIQTVKLFDDTHDFNELAEEQVAYLSVV